MLRALALVVALSFVAAPAQAEDDQLKIKGVGKPPAGKTGGAAILMSRRAAKVVARRNLLAALAEMMQLDMDDAWLKTTFAGDVTTDEGTRIDGGFEVTAMLPWRKVATVLGEQYGKVAAAEAAAAEARAEAKAASEARDAAQQALSKATEELNTATTGLAQVTAAAKQSQARLAELESKAGTDSPRGSPLMPLIAAIAGLVVGVAGGRALASK